MVCTTEIAYKWGGIAAFEEQRKDPDKYSEEEINHMLAVATVDAADLVHLFVRTGVRDEEAMYMHWGNVNWTQKQIVVDEKPEYQWRPKDKETRIIPVEDGILLKRLAARRKGQSPARTLIFPNTNGEPGFHLIKKLHKVVKKMAKRGWMINGAATLHGFRRAYASYMIRHSDLQIVQKLLGHSDIETTSRYLAPDHERARRGTRKAFKGIGD